jgi:diaminohydroxyphosphoribosylaminopyrimidine deaminase/5-amino-6-(5-phosphoribosylamino)uracil reductase
MAAALALAQRGLGATWPNPSVGCVIVGRDGRVVGRGRTGLRGRPHAETNALAMAGDAARGANAYVTLEPCSHHGQTPPCADALVAAGVTRVVVAAGDPDPRVNGSGLARLRDAGIAVECGFMADAAQETLAGFFARVRLGRPLVTLKLATTLDGRIATAAGESQWITGAEARREVHALRGRHDAVMTGIGTLLADDPDLTCRLPGYAHRPTVRIIADGCLRTPLGAHIVTSANHAPSWILYHTAGAPAAAAQPGDIQPTRAQLLAEAGARCILVPKGEGGIDLAAALTALGTRGLNRILVEAGARLAGSLLRADLVDRIVWFHAPALLGSDALPALGVDRLDAMPRFKPSQRTPRLVGVDMMSEFERG